jgi:hypothetical protein
MSTTTKPIQQATVEEEAPTNRIGELEEARRLLAGARQYVNQADELLEQALEDGRTELYVFPALVLDLVENCARATRKALRSRRFVDA